MKSGPGQAAAPVHGSFHFARIEPESNGAVAKTRQSSLISTLKPVGSLSQMGRQSSRIL